jgi:cytochrome c553
MKKTRSLNFEFLILFVIGLFLITACEGPEGPAGPQGPVGPQGLQGNPGPPCTVVDNGNGTFTLTCEGSPSVTFGETDVPPAYQNADVTRGGQLYDKYWKVTAGAAPTGEHSLYPSFGAKTGETTWRCKECHGWDYIGKDGRYASGSHYTGIKGLFPNNKSLWRAYISISDDHGYGSGDLAVADIWDLVKFYKEGMLDINSVLSADGNFKGNMSSGGSLYDNGVPGCASGAKTINAACTTCHGSDGTIETVTGFSNFPGFLSNDNPQEFLHKVRFGHPGSTMPASNTINGSLADVVNVSAYSQTLSPVLWSGTSVSRGGQLYDKYWIVTAGSIPTGEHMLYPANGAKTGETTWRCKECHGWDYIGKDGRYSGGSHYTGIDGLFPASSTKWQAFMEVKDKHGYGAGEFADSDIWDLVAFIDAGLYDINFMLNSDGSFRGDVVNGQALYDNGVGGGTSCTTCHGADGLNLVVSGFENFPGFLSNDNPQEFAHKVFFGHPGSAMVITYDFGATAQDVADISAYCQTLPQN